MQKNLFRERVIPIIIGFPSIIGACAIIYSTHFGPWAFSDSTAYLDAARNLVDGVGFGHITPAGRFEYVSGHPPFYHLLLALVGAAGFDFIEAARWINILLFGLLILILGLLIYKISRSIWASTIICFGVVASPVLIDSFSGMMSEPPFIFFGTIGLFLLVLYQQSHQRVFLFIAAISTGLALITRYPGVAYIITGSIFLITINRFDWKNRILDMLFYSVLSCLPMGVWLIWLYTRPETVSIRQISSSVQNIWDVLGPLRVDMINVFWGWLPFVNQFEGVHYRAKLGFFIVTGLCVIIILVASIRKFPRAAEGLQANPNLLLVLISSLFLLSYITTLSAFYFISFVKPDINDRMLSPAQPFFLTLVISSLFLLGSISTKKSLIRVLSLTMTLLCVFSYGIQSKELLNQYHLQGKGFTSNRWRSSKTLEVVQKLPSDIPIITNEPDGILFHTGRSAFELPELFHNNALEDFHPFGENKDDPVERIFREEGAALILFNEAYWQLRPIYGEKTEERLEELTRGLRLHYDAWDGEVYFYNR